MTSTLTAYRGHILHFTSDPGASDHADAFESIEDGVLLVSHGKVVATGSTDLLKTLPAETTVIDHRGKMLMPGFVDTHIHYPQTDMIGSGGQNLLDWLNHYTFPTEAAFGDAAHATEVAGFFLDELMRNGTTSALVYGSVHRQSAASFFEVAAARQLRMVAGKALMDRNCPAYLCDTADTGYVDTSELIEQWNGVDRLNYAITPRFAITSTTAQMERIAQLAREHPDVHLHTHVAENMDEVRWVQELYPESRSYLDVYDRYGLLRDRAIYAHCIHLDAADRKRMGASGASGAFCPTSNLYLGSGLFDIAATDGTSFSMLRTLGEAYKVAQMSGQRLSPLRAFYLATLAGAQTLGLEDRIGSFQAGREADFIVLDPDATPLIARRMALAKTLVEKLLILMTLGDDRVIGETYVMGVASKKTLPLAGGPLH
jgi:guanine deaminase